MILEKYHISKSSNARKQMRPSMSLNGSEIRTSISGSPIAGPYLKDEHNEGVGDLGTVELTGQV